MRHAEDEEEAEEESGDGVLVKREGVVREWDFHCGRDLRVFRSLLFSF